MPPPFQRDYLVRLPLPIAQLYSRAYNAKDARSRHDNAFYLFEALVKLSASISAVAYLHEVEQGASRVPALDRMLAQLALPSLGQWLAMMRELSRHFAAATDAATRPLGHLAAQLDTAHRDLPHLLALYRRIKNGPDGSPAGDQACSLTQVFDALVQYRNGVFGHGGPRFASFYENEIGPLLFPALNDLLAEGVFEPLGRRGTRLVHVSELRGIDEHRVEVGLRELVGLQGERIDSLTLPSAVAAHLAPGRVAVLWPGWQAPLRLDPLLLYRESELADELLFLNRDRNGRQVEYLSYTTGRTERDRSTAAAMAALLSRVANRTVGEADLEAWAEQSLGDTPSVETLLGACPPPARQLGEYEILGELGRGGMGVVYLARQLSLGRLVALKMLPSDLAGDEVALARFRREIRHLARCEHPNIVKVLASGTFADGQLYYAMEYVPGCDLEHVWRELAVDPGAGGQSLGTTTWNSAVLTASRKQRDTVCSRTTQASSNPSASELPLPPLPELPSLPDHPGGYVRHVAALVRDAAWAVQAVHDQQVVHRDIKPANLMLTPDGIRVVLMDFGLAKGQTMTLSASRQGGLLGTLRYAAPEQLAAANMKVGPPADIRALGVTLWEMLTRRRLFGDADDEVRLTQEVLTSEVPSLRSIDPTLPRDLEAIVARATERRPADRIASAGQMATYLQMYLDGQPLPIRPPSVSELMVRWMRERRGLVATAGAAACAILLTAAIAVVRIDAARRDAETARHAAVASQLDVERANDRLQHQLTGSYIDQAAGEMAARRFDRGLALLYQAQAGAAAGDPLAAGARRLMAGWSHEAPQIFRHAEPLKAFALSADGKRLATAAGKAVIVWDVTTGRPIAQALGHREPVLAVALSPEGRAVLTGSADGTARRWDATTGRPIGKPLDHGHPVRAVAFHPQGRAAVTAAWTDAQQWHLADGQPLGLPMRHEKEIVAVAYSPQGGEILTAGGDATARLWNSDDGRPRGEPLHHAARVNALAFSPDGATAVTGSDDNTARLWDVATQTARATLEHDGVVAAVAFSPDGRTVATGSWDRTARLWDATTGQPRDKPLVHAAPVDVVAFDGAGSRLATGGRDASLWELKTGARRDPPLRHDAGGVFALRFTPDSGHLVSAGSDSCACVWNLARGRPHAELRGHTDEILAVACSRLPGIAVTGSADGTARLWDLPTQAMIGKPLEHGDEVVAVAFSPDGQVVATASNDETVRLWNLPTGGPQGEPIHHHVCPGSIAFSPDGQTLATGGWDRAAHLWDVATGRPHGKPMRHGERGFVMAVAFRADGKMLVTAGGDRTARLWDAHTGEPIGQPLAHDDVVDAVAFHPTQPVVITAGRDHTARRWNLETGVELLPRLAHDDVIYTAAFSPDGATALTASRDQSARLWDAATGRLIGEPFRHEDSVLSARYSPDGHVVLTAGGDRTVRLWDVATGKPRGLPFRHDDLLRVAVFNENRAVLTGADDHVARVWEIPGALPGDDGGYLTAWFTTRTGWVPEGEGRLRVAKFDELLEASEIVGVDRELLAVGWAIMNARPP